MRGHQIAGQFDDTHERVHSEGYAFRVDGAPGPKALGQPNENQVELLPKYYQKIQIFAKRRLVELSGIEPLTSCMPCKRSPS